MKKRQTLQTHRTKGHRIAEYPLLHVMLGNSFAKIYEGTVSGSPVHLYLGDYKILRQKYHGRSLSARFWSRFLGEAIIFDCGCTLWSMHLCLKPGRVRGIFEKNSFIFSSQAGMLTVDISKKGDIDSILYYFGECVPPFLADLIRDFPGRHYLSDRVLLLSSSQATRHCVIVPSWKILTAENSVIVPEKRSGFAPYKESLTVKVQKLLPRPSAIIVQPCING